jgi:hypothetical protein
MSISFQWRGDFENDEVNTLHVDFGSDLAAFYFQSCGFTPTDAGSSSYSASRRESLAFRSLQVVGIAVVGACGNRMRPRSPIRTFRCPSSVVWVWHPAPKSVYGATSIPINAVRSLAS